MKFQQMAGAAILAFASIASAQLLERNILWGEDKMGKMVKRATTTTSAAASSTTTKVADSACTNGPLTRACWSNGFSIATDFDQKFPTTGKTVTYNLEITNSTCNPDGHGARTCLLINNQYPGPLITANWGDNLVINVKNSMQDNGTSIHWHGVRQYHSPGSDGVNGLTECPLAPGDSKTYSFQVTQFGSSWYHAHFSSQYGDGVVGTMVFNGPASSNYDIDLGPYAVTEWYYPTSYQINALASANLQTGNPPPNADNVLINGTNQNAAGGGKYSQVSLHAGKKYRLRLVNTASDNFIRVSLDNHQFTVMASDFIPIKPFVAQWLLLGIGQRYDVVINANQTAGNYWFRADTAADCASGNNFYGRAIWTYDTVAVATPSSSAFTEPSTCVEPSPIVPYWKQSVPSTAFQTQVDYLDVNLTQAQVTANGGNLVVWALNTSSINIAWDNPMLSYVMNGNTSYPTSYNVLEIPVEGTWSYWIIQELATEPGIPHPIHLHGHDFFVLGQGAGTFDLTTYSTTLNFANPPRRDTAMLPGGGWLAIAFNANNPGTWLMHCHIAWHISEGLGVQFLEAKNQITLPSTSAYQQTCNNWKSYEPNAYYKKDDSGL